MGTIAEAAGGLPFRRTDPYELPDILEVMPMRRTTKERTAKLLETIGAVAAVANAVIALANLLYDIVRNRKQKSNRPDQG